MILSHVSEQDLPRKSPANSNDGTFTETLRKVIPEPAPKPAQEWPPRWVQLGDRLVSWEFLMST